MVSSITDLAMETITYKPCLASYASAECALPCFNAFLDLGVVRTIIYQLGLTSSSNHRLYSSVR